MDLHASFRCLRCKAPYDLFDIRYECACGGLLDVAHDLDALRGRSAASWRALFAERRQAPVDDAYCGSGVWRYRELVHPFITDETVVSLGEGHGALVHNDKLSQSFGGELFVKQCGHSATGSFKDLGMTVLMSHVRALKMRGREVRVVLCASTGDTSAALAAYGAAAGIDTVVLLPAGRGMLSQAQLLQPRCHQSRVVAIDTDFDGCMRHVQRLCAEPGVYLANSKNSLRIEGQKTVAFEIAEQLGYRVPDWVVLPSGNLGNAAAIWAGFQLLAALGLTNLCPRILCAQVQAASPFYEAFGRGFDALTPVVASDTFASAIRIGNPVSYERAVRVLKESGGSVGIASEAALLRSAEDADAAGLYVCPQTATALAVVRQERALGTIAQGARVVVVSTAHGLKFGEFQSHVAARREDPVPMPDDAEAVVRLVTKP